MSRSEPVTKFKLAELTSERVSRLNDDEIDGEHEIDRIAEIERLAALDPIDYDLARDQAVNRLGIRTGTLDRAVAKKRRDLGLQTDDDEAGQGRLVKIEDVLPWPEPIEGDRVATALAASLRRYAVVPDSSAETVALWILHSWLVNDFTISPRLAVTSPTKGCGKTTVLRFLNQVARRPKRAGSISPPALFRAIEKFQPTLILDETEKYIEHGSDLHALLNEGHCKGGAVWRVIGDEHDLREFSVFAAVAFAANGRLPDDLEQRSIVIEMQRRLPGEFLEELREGRCEQLRNLAKMCARWADDVVDDLRGHDPDMGGLINRVADNWRPLFAIADMIGSDWPARAREAAATLMPKAEGDSNGTMLLADIRAIFNDKQLDRETSEQLCEALAAMEGRPWAEIGNARKPITKNQLARRLDPFKIKPDSVRIGDRTPKGYHRHQFEEAWQRYLSPTVAQGAYEPQQRDNTDEMGTSAAFQTATGKPDVAVQKCEKPPSNGRCCVVAFQNPENDPLREDATAEAQKCAHCGQGGDTLEVRHGMEAVWLHQTCRHGWREAQDDITIPEFLRRLPAGAAE